MSAHFGSVSVVEATYLGRVFERRPDGVARPDLPDCSPGAGEDLVGPPAEQERVGALVDLVEERPGLVVEQSARPIRRARIRPCGPRPARRAPASRRRRRRCVMVVSFMRSVPFSLGFVPLAPRVGGLSPQQRTDLALSDTASRISFEDFRNDGCARSDQPDVDRDARRLRQSRCLATSVRPSVLPRDLAPEPERDIQVGQLGPTPLAPTISNTCRDLTRPLNLPRRTRVH